MKIVVLHGSPKGEVSVTMQYVRYLQHTFPRHEFIFFPVATSEENIVSTIIFLSYLSFKMQLSRKLLMRFDELTESCGPFPSTL